MYTDTLFSKFKSLNGTTCTQLFNDTELIRLHPSKSKADARECLNEFIDDIGIPINVRFDHASEQLGAGSIFMTSIKKHSIN